MNQDDYLDWADRLSEELERDVRRYPQELKEEEPGAWKRAPCGLANLSGDGIRRPCRWSTSEMSNG